ncbi:hypothetical protein PEC301889_10810 [Pectobacterium carotovorum subsp. carotovorum]|nr:hypothetical protein PEC301889_10810 [Pectobacterium carotovorum subsp. carotovorum]
MTQSVVSALAMMLRIGCLTTRTVYVLAQYVPLQAELTFTATGCKLTYAQVVYWIDPLLTAIDQANNQLSGIRRTESIYSSQ